MKLASTRFLALLGIGLLGLQGCDCGPEPTPEPTAATITAFTADPATSLEGDDVTLAWTTENAVSIELVTDAGDAIGVAGLDVADGSVVVNPTTTTVYTLTAKGEEGTDPVTAEVTVTVNPVPEPEITSFTADPATIVVDESSTLAWVTANVDSVEITDAGGNVIDLAGADAAAGSVAVSPTETTVYTLTATGRGGETTSEATVTVVPIPLVDSFTIDPDMVGLPGGDYTLAWQTTDVDRVIITDDAGTSIIDTDTDLDGEIVVNPEITTVYTLTASGPGGDAAPAEVTALVLPIVDTFTATPSTILAGDEVTLAWATRAAAEGSITGPSGFTYTIPEADLAAGTTTATIDEGGLFTLTIVSGTLDATETASVTLTTSPRINSLVVTPETVTADADNPATVNLSWNIDNADSLTLEADTLGAINVSTLPVTVGDVDVAITETTIFTLTAINADGQDVATVTATAVLPPVIDSFVALPSVAGAGETIELTWATTNAVGVTLEKDGTDLGVDPTLVDGSTTDVVAAEATYILTARSVTGFEVQQTLTVTVAAPTNVSFTATPETAGPGESVVLAWENLGGTSLEISDGTAVVCNSADVANIAMGDCTVNPTVTTTYTLSVTNATGTDTADATVTVTDGPIIRSFDLAQSIITLNETVALSWIVDNDLAGTIPSLALVDDQGTVYDVTAVDPNAGTLSVTPAAIGTYVFTLTASTAGTTDDTATATLEVIAAAAIDTFVATNELLDTVNGPDSSDLSWTTTGASTIDLWEIDSSGTGTTQVFASTIEAEVAAHTVTVSPTATTRYRLVATNPAGTTDTAELTVQVDIARIDSFTASEPGVTGGTETMVALAGEPVELEWATTGADTVTMDPAIVEITATAGTFADISGTGTALSFSSGDGATSFAFPAGFTFPFYGSNRAEVVVGADGFLSFDTTESGDYSNRALPSTSAPDAMLAPFWDDLTPGDGFWQHFAGQSGQPDYVVVQWSSYDLFSGAADLNFQVLLFANGTFEFRYGTMTYSTQARADGSSATIGYQDDTGTSGYVVSHNTAVEGGLSNTGYLFDPRLPSSGSMQVVAEQTQTYELTATNANGGQTAEVTVEVWPFDFTIEPMEIELGDSLTLNWTVTGATDTQVTVDGVDLTGCSAAGDPTVVGTCEWTPSAVGTYEVRLVATDSASGVTVTSAPRAITVYPVLGITALAADPAYISAGGTADLTWTVVGADYAEIQLSDGTLVMDTTTAALDPLSGTFAVTPAATTEYTFIAHDTANSRTVQATTTVFVDAAQVLTFNVSEPGVAGGSDTLVSLAGEPVELEWTTADADTVELDPPPFGGAFIDISATGTQLTFDSDDYGKATFDFPSEFVFPYYGTDRAGAMVATDGFVSFDQASSANSGNETLPDPSTPEGGILAVFWDDLDRTENTPDGQAYWQYFPAQGMTPAHLVIQWKDWHVWSATTNLNFEVVLFENGVFSYRYGPMTGSSQDRANGSSATIGYENDDGTDGFTVSHNTVVEGGLSGNSYVFGLPSLPLDGSIEMAPVATTTYVLTAENANGAQSASVDVEVWPFQFSMSADTIDEGEVIDLAFSVGGATEAHIEANGTTITGCSGTGDPIEVACTWSPTVGTYDVQVVVTNTTTGQTVASAIRTVTVFPAFDLFSFEVSPEFIAAGQSADLTWSASGADRTEIQLLDGTVVMDTAVDALDPLAGTYAVSPTETTEYVLVIHDTPNNRTLEASVTLWVDAARIISFTTSETSIVAGESVTLTWDTENDATPVLQIPPAEATSPGLATGGTELVLTGGQYGAYDDGSEVLTFPAGFVFPFMDTDRTELLVSADGYVTFNTSVVPDLTDSTLALPSTDAPNGGIIAPFLSDLLGQATATVHYVHTAAAAGEPASLAIRWEDFAFYTDDGTTAIPYGDLNFELVLYDDGAYEFRYGVMSTPEQQFADGAAASIGWESDDARYGQQMTYFEAIEGGLSDRAWRYDVHPGDGSAAFSPTNSGTYELCVEAGSRLDCSEITITVVHPGDVMISEYMANPFITPDEMGEWVELHNTTDADIDLAGWTLMDDGADSHVIDTANGTTVIPAGGYLVLGYSATGNTGYTPDYVYSGFLLSNTADEIVLTYRTFEIDRVTYDASVLTEGYSRAADPRFLDGNPTSNDDLRTFCDGSPVFGSPPHLGSPGVENGECDVSWMYQSFSSSPGSVISSTLVEDTIAVSLGTCVPTSISIDVDISHEFIGDMYITLANPDGTTVVLHNESGGGAVDLIGNYPDTLTPAQALDPLLAGTLDGNWTLTIDDTYPGLDDGVLNSWTLNFSCP